MKTTYRFMTVSLKQKQKQKKNMLLLMAPPGPQPDTPGVKLSLAKGMSTGRSNNVHEM